MKHFLEKRWYKIFSDEEKPFINFQQAYSKINAEGSMNRNDITRISGASVM